VIGQALGQHVRGVSVVGVGGLKPQPIIFHDSTTSNPTQVGQAIEQGVSAAARTGERGKSKAYRLYSALQFAARRAAEQECTPVVAILASSLPTEDKEV